MKKKTLFFIALLLAPIMSLHVWGKTSPQVIWCEGNTTLYFLHSETSYYEGDTYDGQIVTNSWKGESKVLRQDKEWDVPDWASEDDYPTIQKNCTRVVFDSSFAFVRPYSTFKWFSSFTKLASIEGIEYLNTSRVTVMNSMFYNCKSLTSIFLDFFDVTRVVNATGMFTSCEKLRYIYCENTWNIEQTTGMFVYCNNLPRYSWTSPTDGSMANPTTGFLPSQQQPSSREVERKTILISLRV